MTFVDAFLEAFSAALVGLLAALPTILGALLVLILGWIVAGIFARIISRVLRAVRFNQLAERAEINVFLERTGTDLDPAGTLGMLVKWFVRIIFVVAAANVLDMPQVSEFLNQILAYLPNVAVAVVILVLGAALARFLRDLTRGAISTAGAQESTVATVSTVVYWSILVTTLLTALQQLGIANILSETLYTAMFGAAALAFALAFGLGTREVAADLVAGWTLAGHLKEGDLVQTAEFTGTVTRVGLTATILQHEQGQFIVPNSQLAQQVIQR